MVRVQDAMAAWLLNGPMTGPDSLLAERLSELGERWPAATGVEIDEALQIAVVTYNEVVAAIAAAGGGRGRLQ